MLLPAQAHVVEALDEDFAIPCIEIDADKPLERGRQYGELAAPQLDASIEYYAHLFELTSGLSWSEISERALLWEPILEDFDADLAEEMRGIAEGSSRTLGEIYALNARGEMVYSNFMQGDGCTSFALTTEGSQSGHSFAGQNWDWRVGAAQSRVLLRIRQGDKPTITTITEAGQLGRHGVNSEGIAVFANGLPTKTSSPGVLQAAIRRKALDQPSLDKTMSVVFKAQQQIPANVLLAQGDFAIDIETVPGDRRWMYPQQGIVTHANHYELFQGPDYQPNLGTDSLWRSHILRRKLAGLANLTVSHDVIEGIAEALADRFGHPNGIAVHPKPDAPEHLKWATLASIIVDMTEGNWYIADGAPDVAQHRRLPWNVFER